MDESKLADEWWDVLSQYVRAVIHEKHEATMRACLVAVTRALIAEGVFRYSEGDALDCDQYAADLLPNRDS